MPSLLSNSARALLNLALLATLLLCSLTALPLSHAQEDGSYGGEEPGDCIMSCDECSAADSDNGSGAAAPAAAAAGANAAAVDLTSRTANVPVEYILPSLFPVLYGVLGVGVGDATIILRWATLTTAGWFDAVSAYHPTAVGVFTDMGRRPESEWTPENVNIAVLYAAHKVFSWMAPESKDVFGAMLSDVGLDPTDVHEGKEDPIGIGNLAAANVIAARANDGFNQLGMEGAGTFTPRPYADYTGYVPTNTADELTDPRLWQPELITNPFSGLSRVQSFVTPQYRLTTPFSYPDPEEFGVGEPKKSYDVSSDGAPGELYKQQADDVLAVSAALTEEHKLLAEFFEDKIFSLGISAANVVAMRGAGTIEFVQADFLANLAAYDAGIVIWQEKARWNAVRPFSAISHIYGDEEVTAYGGPGKGTVDNVPGNQWRPYMQTADHPEYPSATAGFCAAHSLVMRKFFDSDTLEWTVPRPAGTSVREPGTTPAADTALSFATWTQFDEQCGQSRVWGGVHFPDAVPAGQSIGSAVGEVVYKFFDDHLKGEGVAGMLHV